MSDETNMTIQSDSETTTSALALAPPHAAIEPPAPKLAANQAEAVKMLTNGASISQIAKELHVDRCTIWRWRTHDPNFIAAMNRWRGEIQAETRDRLLAMSEKATDSLGKVIDKNEGHVELKFLEKMGCLAPGPDRPIDPYEIFGNGIADETGRTAIMEGMRRVAASMSPEQLQQAPTILALGIVSDNTRAGRPSPPELRELAGLPIEDTPKVQVAIHSLTEACPPAADSHPPPAAPSVVQTKTHVIVRRCQDTPGAWLQSSGGRSSSTAASSRRNPGG